jgi:hypothetical protein
VIILPHFQMTNVAAVMGGAGAGVTFSLAYVTTATDATSQTTYTFAAQSIGVADTNRIVVVGICARSATTTLDFSTVTIGGVSATLTKKQRTTTDTSTTTIAGLYQAAVPTGTTGDVVVTFNEAAVRAAVAVWRLVTATSTATATASSAVDPADVSLTIPSGGGVIVFAASSAGTSYTPTGYTENFDGVIGASTTVYTAGTNTSSSGATSLIADASSVPVNPTGVSAAWGN